MILLAAKAGAEIFERWLRQPAVLGELFAEVAIGPYAPGAVNVPGVGRLFGEAATNSTSSRQVRLRPKVFENCGVAASY